MAFTLSPVTFALKGGGFYPSATPRRCKREEHMVLRNERSWYLSLVKLLTYCLTSGKTRALHLPGSGWPDEQKRL